jgi:hypothetical protein
MIGRRTIPRTRGKKERRERRERERREEKCMS